MSGDSSEFRLRHRTMSTSNEYDNDRQEQMELVADEQPRDALANERAEILRRIVEQAQSESPLASRQDFLFLNGGRLAQMRVWVNHTCEYCRHPVCSLFTPVRDLDPEDRGLPGLTKSCALEAHSCEFCAAHIRSCKFANLYTDLTVQREKYISTKHTHSIQSKKSLVRLLPDSLWLAVMEYQDVAEVGKTATVCERFSRLSLDDTLWARKIRSYNRIVPVPPSEKQYLKQLVFDPKALFARPASISEDANEMKTVQLELPCPDRHDAVIRIRALRSDPLTSPVAFTMRRWFIVLYRYQQKHLCTQCLVRPRMSKFCEQCDVCSQPPDAPNARSAPENGANRSNRRRRRRRGGRRGGASASARADSERHGGQP